MDLPSSRPTKMAAMSLPQPCLLFQVGISTHVAPRTAQSTFMQLSSLLPALFCLSAHAREFPCHTGLGPFASPPSLVPAGWRTQAHPYSSDGEDCHHLSSSQPCRTSSAFQVFPQLSFAGFLAGRHKSILTLPSQLGPWLQTRVSRGGPGRACLWRGHAGGLGPGLRPSPASTCHSLAPSVRGGHALWRGLCRQVF